MKKLLTLTVLLLATQAIFAQARRKADRETMEWRYDIECVGNGKEGTYAIKIWSYSKKANVAIEQAKKNAVHGILFKGYGGNDQGCVSQKPIATNPNIEQEKADFFAEFFEDGGKYMKYVSDAADAAPDRVKVGREYKVGIIVIVNKDALRKDMEQAGVIRGLSSGF